MLITISSYVFIPNTYAKYTDTESATISLSIRKPKYTVIFDKNGADGTETMSNQTFTYGTGSLNSNVYTKTNSVFLGWSLNSDGTGTIYEDGATINTLTENDGEEITLYAVWQDNEYDFYLKGPCYFKESNTHDNTCSSGSTNYIDTGIALFSEENYYKDFEASFTLDSLESAVKMSVFMANMNEAGDPWPGFVVRYEDGIRFITNSHTGNEVSTVVSSQTSNLKVIVKRENGMISYSLDDGATYVDYLNFDTFERTFSGNMTYGAGINKDGVTPFRFMEGTLSEMYIKIADIDKYIVHFDANGGTGSMYDQFFKNGISKNLIANTFTRTEYTFGGWNTEADGSGDSYTDMASIQDLGNANTEVTLYAQWIPDPAFYVRFNSNGGTGSMETQRIRIGSSENLNKNTYLYEGYIFKEWNTKADGTGTSYQDEESVSNLIDEYETIDLYAQWDDAPHYFVRFNANGGTGDAMPNQEFVYGVSSNLNKGTYEKTDYLLVGWNTKADGTGDSYLDETALKLYITEEGYILDLYAQYERISYTYDGEIEFTGSNYLNTEIPLFSEGLANRDFEIKLTVVEIYENNNDATLLNSLLEKSPYPGFLLRFHNQDSKIRIVSNTGSSSKTTILTDLTDNTTITIKRENGILKYSLDNGSTLDGTEYTECGDYSSFTSYFDTPLTIGATLNSSNNPFRYFKGKVKDISITVDTTTE